MAWRPIAELVGDLSTGVPSGTKKLGRLLSGEPVVMTMMYRPDGQRVWRVSPIGKNGEWMATPEDVLHWDDLPAEDPA